MAVTPDRKTVDTTPDKIADNTVPDRGSEEKTIGVLVKNTTGTGSVFLGGSNLVTTTDGFEWEPDDGPIFLDLEPGEELWGIAPVSQALHVLRVGR